MSDRRREHWTDLLAEQSGGHADVTLDEIRTLSLTLTLVLQAAVLALDLMGVWQFFGRSELWGTYVLPGLLLVSGWFLPFVPGISRRVGQGEVWALLVSFRRQGRLAKWDRGVMVLLALILAFGILSSDVWILPGIPALLHCVVLLLSFRGAEAPTDNSDELRRWVVPEWLRRQDENGHKEREEGSREDVVEKPHDPARISGPDEDAEPVFLFDTRTGDRYPVGVCISEDALRTARKLNAASDGSLYHQHPEEVVHAFGQVVGEAGRRELERMAKQISRIAEDQGWTPFQTANRVLEFVQEVIPYGFDEDSTAELPDGPFVEYGRFAIETMWDGVGDCECTSILCAALLAYLGFETALLFVTVEEGGHVAVGLRRTSELGTGVLGGLTVVSGGDGVEYLFGETAMDGQVFGFGTNPWPDGIEVRSVHPIAPVPWG